MPSASILLAATILIGSLVLQVTAIRLRRPWRRRFDELAEELLRDSFLPISHWRKVEFYRIASRGGWASLCRFARTPARLIRVGTSPGDPAGDVSSHPIEIKLRDLHDLAAKLEWAAHPVSFTLMVAVSASSLLVGRAIGHVRGAERHLSVSDIRRAASGELLSGAEAAYGRMLKPGELLAVGSTGRSRRGRSPCR